MIIVVVIGIIIGVVVLSLGPGLILGLIQRRSIRKRSLQRKAAFLAWLDGPRQEEFNDAYVNNWWDEYNRR